MKHVWMVTVKCNNVTLCTELFSEENSAQDYADVYRESDILYRVAVIRKEVR